MRHDASPLPTVSTIELGGHDVKEIVKYTSVMPSISGFIMKRICHSLSVQVTRDYVALPCNRKTGE